MSPVRLKNYRRSSQMTHAPHDIKAFVLDDYEDFAASVPSYEKVKARAQVTILKTKLANDAQLTNALRDVQILLPVRERTKLGDKELALAPALKFISQTGAGIGHLDLAAATRRGIAVCLTGRETPVSTIELTMALILSCLRKIPLVDRRMRAEAWPPIPGYLLNNRTVGIVGLGRIGGEVARLCLAFHARVLATGKTLTDERARAAGVTRVSMEELFRESDIVTVHAKFNRETRGLIGAKEIGSMKPGAFLVNTSRGPIVSETALVRALETGQLGGVGLDVFDEEPLPFEHPLRRFDNAILLPHRGYATVEVLQERFERAMSNVADFIDGKPLEFLNPEAFAGVKT
jgi:phosphoglycerate dehydrogenase-like enzyme